MKASNIIYKGCLQKKLQSSLEERGLRDSRLTNIDGYILYLFSHLLKKYQFCEEESFLKYVEKKLCGSENPENSLLKSAIKTIFFSLSIAR